jgi:hypothetical protein
MLVAFVMAGCIAWLEWATYTYRPWPGTLEEALRPFLLTVLPVIGLSMIIQAIFDPLAWRVVRRLRLKETRN